MLTFLLDFVVTCFNTRGPWTTAKPALIKGNSLGKRTQFEDLKNFLVELS